MYSEIPLIVSYDQFRYLDYLEQVRLMALLPFVLSLFASLFRLDWLTVVTAPEGSVVETEEVELPSAAVCVDCETAADILCVSVVKFACISFFAAIHA